MQRPLGLTEDNALVILMAAHKLNAQQDYKKIYIQFFSFLCKPRVLTNLCKKVFNWFFEKVY